MNSPQRILIAHNNYQQRGGEDFVVEQEIDLLRDRGHDVFILKEDSRRIASMSPVELAQCIFWNRHVYDQVKEMIRRENIDLVHVHNFFPLLSASIFQAAHDADAALVLTAHNYRMICLNGLLFRDGGPCHDCVDAGSFMPGVFNRCYRDSYVSSAVCATTLGWQKEKQTINRTVDRFIAPSEFAAGQLERGGVGPSKIVVKPNFIKYTDFSGEVERTYVAMAGRLTEDKGVDLVAEAWDMMPASIPLKIAGAGPLRSFVEELAKQKQNVSYEGWLEEEPLVQMFRGARILVFPSLMYETAVAISVIQAMAAGCAIVVSDACAAAPTIVESGAGVSFESGNAQSLAAVIERLWNDSARVESMGRNARDLYRSRFMPEANYPLLMAVYEEAVRARQQRRPAPKSSSEALI